MVNVQSVIFNIMGMSIVFFAMVIVITIFFGILRISIIVGFDFDFVKWWRNRHVSQRD